MMSTLCRVCVNPFRESDMRHLFDGTNMIPSTLATMLAEIGEIDIQQESELPRFCCRDCARRLEDATELRKLCRESDRKLRKMLINTGSSRKEEINDGVPFYKQREEPVTTPEVRVGSPESVIKTEALEIDSTWPPDDDYASDNSNLETRNDPNDPDFGEEEPKKKKVTKPKKSTKTKKGSNKRKATKDKKNTEDTSASDKSIAKPTEKPQPGSKTLFQCSVCGKFLSSRFILKEHEMLHLPAAKQLRHQCQLCPKAYAYTASLQNHLKTHDPNHVFKCDQCDYAGKSPNELKSHLLVHSGERLFKCQHCPKSYARQSILYGHVQRVHFGQKPAKCDLCPKTFVSNYQLRLHRGSAHDGIKPNPCPYCSNKYETKTYLLNHIAERHPETLDKPPKRCAFCGKGYYSIGHYRKHVVKYHRERKDEMEELLKQELEQEGLASK